MPFNNNVGDDRKDAGPRDERESASERRARQRWEFEDRQNKQQAPGGPRWAGGRTEGRYARARPKPHPYPIGPVQPGSGQKPFFPTRHRGGTVKKYQSPAHMRYNTATTGR